MHEQFTALARFYDSLMAGIPYREWVEYVLQLASRHEHTVYNVLDAGCGTGSASYLFVEQGCRVLGFDASEEMVRIAESKARGRNNPRFQVSRMEDFRTPELFDTAVSLFDTVNYILEPANLQAAFHAVAASLEPNGLFLFDMNTPYALEMELFTQNNLRSRGEPKYSWVSKYDSAERITTVNMDFYVKNKGSRETIKETHFQRAYTIEEVHQYLQAAGFEILETLEAFTFRPPCANTDRAYITARRIP